MTVEERRGELRHDDKVSVRWVSRRLHIDRKTVYKLIEAGEFDALDMPGIGFRIAHGSVLAFEERCRVVPRR